MCDEQGCALENLQLRRKFHNQHVIGNLKCARFYQPHEFVIIVRADRHDDRQLAELVASPLRIVQVAVLVVRNRLLVEEVERLYDFRVQLEAIVVNGAQ